MTQLESLKQEHRELDEEIYEAYKNYADDLEIDEMKMKKLFLKRKIVMLEENYNDNEVKHTGP
jgi:hypothetical protein